MTNITEKFIDTLIEPYMSEINNATTTEELIDWIPQAFKGPYIGNALETINQESLESNDLEAVKTEIRDVFQTKLGFNENNELRNPWEIVDLLPELGHGMFDLPQIIITVKVGPNSYEHPMSRELCYGVLFGLNNNPNILLFLYDQPITMDSGADFLILDEKTYIAKVHNQKLGFNDSSFIQGIVTASEWLNISAKTVITELMENTEKGLVPAKF